ncbi:Uncharacterized protein HZ326_26842 [Fusarium oxysporum f. sp. albedinis]|nr:Uncharacterized protein HZ326_26842 [Fusarium oxysporum f. sp. albedinis]
MRFEDRPGGEEYQQGSFVALEQGCLVVIWVIKWRKFETLIRFRCLRNVNLEKNRRSTDDTASLSYG